MREKRQKTPIWVWNLKGGSGAVRCQWPSGRRGFPTPGVSNLTWLRGQFDKSRSRGGPHLLKEQVSIQVRLSTDICITVIVGGNFRFDYFSWTLPRATENLVAATFDPRASNCPPLPYTVLTNSRTFARHVRSLCGRKRAGRSVCITDLPACILPHEFRTFQQKACSMDKCDSWTTVEFVCPVRRLSNVGIGFNLVWHEFIQRARELSWIGHVCYCVFCA